jgi:hypothetical protein
MDVQTPEELEQDQEQRRIDKLQAFGQTMSRQRDQWVRARYSLGVDKRWVEDEDQYNGKDNVNRAASQMMTSVEQGYPVTTNHAAPQRSTVYINLTRQKTNAAEARVADILIPTDDRNWGIKPTPDPTVSELTMNRNEAIDPMTGQPVVDQQGRPVPLKAVARAILRDVADKARAMQVEIEDQLVECDYNAELRKVIHDAAKLGTGVLKGPVTTNRTRKAWKEIKDPQSGEGVYVLTIVEEESPASYRIDPRNFFPDPGCGGEVQNGKGAYEREELTARRVRELAKQPGYISSQLRKVLEEGPKRSQAIQDIRDEEQTDLAEDLYERWEYTGEVDYDDLEAAGVNLPEKDVLNTISATVVIINDTVVKAFLNPLEDGSLPYDTFVWEKAGNTVWGYGVPYLMRAQQRVLNAAWRQMMDNAGVTSGPQIVVKPSVIQPADKQWQLSSRKIWYATDDLDDVRKAFASFEFNSHQSEMAEIINMAMGLADAETGVPTIMQGEQGSAPDTVGGMQMLMTSANVVLKRIVKQFDDMITKPHIRRYYDWNMLYNENNDIKGDFSIDARGSSTLVVRDIQNQGILQLLAAGANPLYGKYLDLKKLFERSLQAQHIDPAEVFKTDEDIEAIEEAERQAAQQGQEEDPRIAAAKIRAETDMQRVQAQNQGDLAELQTRLQIAQEQIRMRQEEHAMQMELEMLKMANQQNLTLEQIKAKLGEVAIRERSRKDLFEAESRLKLQVGSGI